MDPVASTARVVPVAPAASIVRVVPVAGPTFRRLGRIGRVPEPAQAGRIVRTRNGLRQGRSSGLRHGRNSRDRNSGRRPGRNSRDRNSGLRPGRSRHGRSSGRRPGRSRHGRSSGLRPGPRHVRRVAVVAAAVRVAAVPAKRKRIG
jgi:hypothetical protein